MQLTGEQFMLKNKKTLASAGLLLLRVAFGCFMLVHGWQEAFRIQRDGRQVPDPIGMGSGLSLVLAIAAEVGCSLLLIAGFGTRLAAVPLAFLMIVALFVVHGGDPWRKGTRCLLFSRLRNSHAHGSGTILGGSLLVG
ncbi:MAG: DoxX family protein [Pirellulaceae bacterium]